MSANTLCQPCILRSSVFVPTDTTQSDLLTLYLSLSPAKRKELFVGTASAADRIGVSQRTIQAWIDAGRVRAVPIGRKFQVELGSLLGYLRLQVSAAE